MTNLTVVRDSGYADRLRAYTIVLDGVVIGTIRNGENKNISNRPGTPFHIFEDRLVWIEAG